MKFLPLTVIGLALFAAPLNAQEMTGDGLPQGDPAIEDGSAGRLQLIPDAAPGTTDFGPPDSPAPSSSSTRKARPEGPSETQKAIAEQERKVALRQARIRAEKDPTVREAYAQAESATTDAERRYAMGLYYDRLCDSMLRANSALKPSIEDLRKQSKRPLEQLKIRGSVWTPGAE